MKVRAASLILVASGIMAVSGSSAAGEATTTSTVPATTNAAAPPKKSGPKPPEQSASSARPAGPCLAPATGGMAIPTGAAIDPAINLAASPASATRNFGSSRKSEDIVFTLATTTPLDAGIEKRLELVADPIVRVGDTTDSALFPEPTFSDLRVSQNRKTISFRVCLDPSNGLAAGKYVGTIRVEGPPGVESTPMTVTANAKDGGVFWWSAVASLLFAFVILLYKAASDERTRRIGEAQKVPDGDAAQKKTRDEAIVAAEGMPQTNRSQKAARKNAITDAKKLPGGKDEAMAEAQSFWSAAWITLKDPAWFVGTLFAIGGVLGALWGIYDANPSWGEAGPVTSAFAIVGAGLAAIGAKTIFTGAK